MKALPLAFTGVVSASASAMLTLPHGVFFEGLCTSDRAPWPETPKAGSISAWPNACMGMERARAKRESWAKDEANMLIAWTSLN